MTIATIIAQYASPGLGGIVSTVPMGSTTYNNGDIPVFTVTDTNAIIGGSVTNGGPNPTPANFLASLIFSYATFDGSTYTLTSDPTQFVVFGFNDNGFGDDNHDDFVGVMSLIPGGTPRRRHQFRVPCPCSAACLAADCFSVGCASGTRRRKLTFDRY